MQVVALACEHVSIYGCSHVRFSRGVGMPVVAVVSQKGGSGKTTLAIQLAGAADSAGRTALIIDLDPQATASQWAAWRQDRPPVVIDSAPPRLAAKIASAKEQGAEFIVVDTPPHADAAANAAVQAADLVLITCRPSAFDLAAIQTTANLVRLHNKPAYVVFTAGNPHAPRTLEEATELVKDFGVPCCPHALPDRAAFRHAAAEGKTAAEFEPLGKAGKDASNLYLWVCKQVGM